MQRYVNQLVEVFKMLKVQAPPFAAYNEPDDFTEMMMEFEEVFLNERGIPASTYSNISKEELPPVEKLSMAQIKKLNKYLIGFLNYCNFFPQFPPNLPEQMIYHAIRNDWEKIILPEIPFESHYEFCSYEEENCPFPGYCTSCDEVNKEGLIMENSENWNPDPRDLLPTNEQAKETYILNRKEDIREFYKNLPETKHIPGVHNYCDRWCERCAFEQLCSVSMLTRKIGHGGKQQLDEVFFSDMQALFEVTNEMVEEQIKKLGISFDMNFETGDNEEISRPEFAEGITKMTKEYACYAGEWLGMVSELFINNPEQHKSIFEVIEWYHLLIAAKLERAVSSASEDIEEQDGIQNDSNGSAKVALIAIEKSIHAWLLVIKSYPAHEDAAIKSCRMLKKLENAVNSFFPDAMKFHRAGFDD